MKATHIAIVTNPRAHNTLSKRLEKTFRVGKMDGIYQLPHPHSPLSPAGTSAYSVLYSLSHPSKQLTHLEKLEPVHLRQLRDIAHRTRKSSGTLHIIGVLDDDSPFGKRRMVEAIVRHFRPMGLKLVLHLGVWHPTPTEFRYSLREIRSLCNESIVLGSLFPLDPAWRDVSTEAFLRALLHDTTPDEMHDILLPLRRGHVFHGPAVGSQDLFLIANHDLHGLDAVSDTLQSWGEHPLMSMFCDHNPDAAICQSLDKYRHMVSVTSRQGYHDAYFGSSLRHPYLEHVKHSSPTTLLEMLNSPHYGYPSKPYRTVALLDEELNSDFDWLLSSYIRNQRDDAYSCVFIDPKAVEGSVVMSNITIDRTKPLAAQLHVYA